MWKEPVYEFMMENSFFFGSAFTGSVNNYKCLEHMDV